MKFKIYDALLEKVDKNTSLLTSKHRATLNTLKPEHREIIYALIFHHNIINGPNDTKNAKNAKNAKNEIEENGEIEEMKEKNKIFFEIPYNGKPGISGKGITFDTECLPPLVQKIIVLYLEKTC